MAACIMFGGAGFVGTHLANFFLDTKRFSRIYIADIKESSLKNHPQVTVFHSDVREVIKLDLEENPEWIFNFAAIHREPGHDHNEYFETNLKGAENVCHFAETINCKSIFFTSSISIYGPCLVLTDETKSPSPTTPYGGSKYPAELIHQMWLNAAGERRLIITRPGVIYGPGDPGNILRMIKAIQKGYFAFPGSSRIHKSYAYIYGFMDSINFMMNRTERLLIYNYVETPTETIEDLAKIVKQKLKSNAPIISISPILLLPVANLLQLFKKGNNPIHPVRVKKARTPTHIAPKVLVDLGFQFQYGFEKSLTHWLTISKEDFN